MCISPISILNKKLDRNPIYDRLRLTVNCGNCIECKNVKRMSMWIRLHYETAYTKCHDGVTIYITNTYNNNCVPKLDNNPDFLCFSKKDVQKYIKRVRSALTRKFGKDSFVKNLKYFVSSEFGSKNSHRPHYHILFFCPGAYPYRWVLRSIIANEWKFGYHKFGRNYGFVDSVGAAHYCAKYICKDIHEDEYFKKFKKRFFDLYGDDSWSRQKLRKALPFYLLSNGIGLSLLQDINVDDLLLGRVFMPDSQLTIKEYKLPLYYERKCFYDVLYKYKETYNGPYIYTSVRPDDFTERNNLSIVDKSEKWQRVSIVYRLNNFGIEMKTSRMRQVYDKMIDIYKSSTILKKNWSYVEEFNKKFHTSFKDGSQISSFISKKLSAEDFYKYNVLYRGLGNISYDFLPVHCSISNFEDDYLTRLRFQSGIPCDVEASDNFINQCIYYDNISDIDFVSDMIQYIALLNKKSRAKDLVKKEQDYIERKSLFILTRSA